MEQAAGRAPSVKAARRRKSAASGRAAVATRRPGAGSETVDLAQLNDRVGYFLRRLQVAIFKDFIRTLGPVDVRPAQYSVLVLIAANPGRSQAVIGKALNIERARLARMLHELERRQWIERRVSSGDGRSPFAVHDRGRQGSHGADREFGGAARAADGQVHRARSAPLAAGTTAEVRQAAIKHDPEKWDPVFGKDHAQTTGSSGR